MWTCAQVKNRVLLFDHPQELRTNQAVVTGVHDFRGSLCRRLRAHRGAEA